MMRYLLLLTLTIALSHFSIAADRFWIGAVDNDWNDTGNWSTSSGGVGGASVPGSSDEAIFDANGNINCTLDINVTIESIDVNSGYTATIDMNGFTFSIIGGVENYLEDGTITDGTGTQTLVITTTNRTRFLGTTFGCDLNANCNRILLSGSTFNGVTRIEKSGTGNDAGNGGNEFNDSTWFVLTNNAYLMTGNVNPDTFNAPLTLTNTGTSIIYMAHQDTGSYFDGNIYMNNTGTGGIRFGNGGNKGGSTLATGHTINVGDSGITQGRINIEHLTQSGGTAQSMTFTGTGYVYLDENDWSGNVTFTAPRLRTDDSRYRGTATLTKSGASNDDGVGGNVFDMDAVITNNGSGRWSTASTRPDSFMTDLTLHNTGTYRLQIANNVADNYIGGDLVINQNTTGTDSRIYVCNAAATTLQIDGDVTITDTSTVTSSYIYFGENGDITTNGTFTATMNGGVTNNYLYLARNTASWVQIGSHCTINNHSSATTSRIYLGGSGDITVNGNLVADNTNSATTGEIRWADGAASTVNIVGTTLLTNAGSGTTRRCYLGNAGDVIYGGNFTLNTTTDATNSQVYLNYATGASGTYNDSIFISQNNASGDGIFFGSNGGSGTLAATKTVEIGPAGFSAGQLWFRNFTQTGATAQSLTLTGTGYLYMYDSDFGGNVTLSSGRFYTRGTRYGGTVDITKTDATDDMSYGGNYFTGNTTLTNNGSGYLGMGRYAVDTFALNVNMVGNGTDGMYLFYDLPGHYIGGNLDITNTGTFISVNSISTATGHIDGDVTILNNGSARPCQIYFCNNGTLQVDGDLDFTSSVTDTTSDSYVSNGTAASLTVDGVATFVNSASGSNNQRLYIGNDGDITFQDSLIIRNSSSGGNSQIYLQHDVTSVGTYNGHIVVETSNASSDGILFGNGGGSGTLAATRTITVGAGGFIAGSLYMRNLTQVGATAQSLTCTGTTYMYNYGNSWGGNVTFSSPRMYVRETLFSGTSNLSKTGASNDENYGGSTYTLSSTINNSGSGRWRLARYAADSFLVDLTINNSGTNFTVLAYDAANHYVAGNLSASNTGGGITIADASNSSLSIGGDATLTNSGSNTTAYTYFGNGGDVTLAGDLSITNSATGTTSEIYSGNGTGSVINITGTTTLTNSAAAATNTRMFMNDDGTTTFGDTVRVANSATGTNSQVYFNRNSSANGTFNDHIILENTNVASDGVYFGSSGGNSTLSATNTILIGAGGFSAGQLYMRDFTQVGNTAQSLTLTGTGYMTNYDNSWGGDVTFIAPRMYTRGTTYSRTAYLEKSSTTTDRSVGGNVFTLDATWVHSGTANEFSMGNGTGDSCLANLTLTNSGGGSLVHGYGTGSNYISGNLTVSNTGTTGSCYTYVSSGTNATTQIDGSVDLSTTATATNNRIYFGNNGDITLDGNLDITHNPGAGTSYLYVASGTNSLVTIAGNTDIVNLGPSGTTNRIYFGNNGDIDHTGTLSIINGSPSNLNEIFVNYNGNSSGTYRSNITVQDTVSTGDGVQFGYNGGSSTLTAGNALEIGPGGYVSGDLRLRNFTQLGTASSNLTLTGTSRLYTRDASFGGALTVSAPYYYLRSSTHDGVVSFTQTGTSTSSSYGDNTYNADFTFTLNAAATVRLADNVANDYNANATFVQTAGTLTPARDGSSTFAGNITVDFASANSEFGSGSGTVVIDGTGAQSFNDGGTTSGFRFRRMTMNKASGIFTLNEPLEIRTTATFTSGVMATTATNILTFRDGATVSGASDASFVDGPVDKIGNEAFAFPVGDANHHQNIAISAPSSSAAQFRAQYYRDSPRTAIDTTRQASIQWISTQEYWTLDRLNTTNNVIVTLSWDTSSGGVTDINDLTVCRYDTASNIWVDEGNDGAPTGDTSTGTVSSLAAITSFSPFTLGTTDFAQNPLPLVLTSFTAALNTFSNVVVLDWATLSEVNTKEFIIERAGPDLEFAGIGSLDASYRSKTRKEYEFTDHSPIKGTNYYRLKMLDVDGEFTYSAIESVYAGQSNQSIEIFPIPIENVAKVNLSKIDAPISALSIYTLSGALVHTQGVMTEESVINVDVSHLSEGLYLLELSSPISCVKQRIAIAR